MKLGGWVHCTKISPEFEFGEHRPYPRLPYPKMPRFAESLRKSKQTDEGVAHCPSGKK